MLSPFTIGRGRQGRPCRVLLQASLGAALLLGAASASAQQFGGNPPRTRWSEIRTDTVQVIFPRGLETQAREVARTVSYINAHHRMSIGSAERMTPIVLQPGTVESNGFVSLSPFRAVFQVTPPRDNFSLGSLGWTALLSRHEYRHALQNMNFRTGAGRTFYDLFGENGQAVVTNALIPDWFWEGDAVFMETALSSQGRGRLPSFLEPFKSLELASLHYPYAKIRNGSLRDMVPDWYPLGYIMTAYGRDTLGPYFWEMATQQALLNRKFIRVWNEAHPGRPYHSLHYGIYPLSAALHYLTGEKIPGFYRRSLAFFARPWDSAYRAGGYTLIDTLKRAPGRMVLHYRYPHPLPDGSVLALKYGNAYTPRIVRIDSMGRESVVARCGGLTDLYFAAGGGRVAWTEWRPDPRWGWKDYSVLRVRDLRTGKTRTLTSRSRYFSPALAPDGSRVAVEEITPEEKSRLVILDAVSGKIIRAFPVDGALQWTYPVFTGDGRALLAAVRDSLGRMALVRQPLSGGDLVMLTPYWLRTLGPPSEMGAYVLFPAALAHTVGLYAVDTRTGALLSVSRRPLGDYSVRPDRAGKRLVFDEFGVRGSFLGDLPVDTAAWVPVDTAGLTLPAPTLADGALRAEGGPIAGRIPPREFTVRPYRKGAHLFRIHSWSFLPTYPEVGLYLQSQDILNTLQWNAGAGYNVDEASPYAAASVSYAGWFPVLYLNYKRRFDRKEYVSGHPLSWDESDVSAGFGVPLNLSAGRYGRSLSLGGFLHRNTLDFHPSPLVKTDRSTVSFLEASLSFSNGLNTAVAQPYPSFGQRLSLDYERALGTTFAQQVTASADVFLPGLYRTHSLYVTGGYGIKDTRRQYKFSDDFIYASGYDAVPYRKIYLWGAHYQLPLAYPDWGTTWIYLLRIRLDGFFDYSRADMLPGISPVSGIYRSVGASVYFDTRLCNALSIPWGVRYSYLLDRDYSAPSRRGVWQLIVPITVF